MLCNLKEPYIKFRHPDIAVDFPNFSKIKTKVLCSSSCLWYMHHVHTTGWGNDFVCVCVCVKQYEWELYIWCVYFIYWCINTKYYYEWAWSYNNRLQTVGSNRQSNSHHSNLTNTLQILCQRYLNWLIIILPNKRDNSQKKTYNQNNA